MNKKETVYFVVLSKLLFYCITFAKSSKTEAGSAGEQHARDKLDGFQKKLFMKGFNHESLQLFF